MTFGERLKFFAKERYGGVGNFAKACGINATQMSKYISGVNEPMRSVLEKFGEAGLSLDWLISGVGRMDAPPSPGFVVDAASPIGTYIGERKLSEVLDLNDPDILEHIKWMTSALHTLQDLLDRGDNTSAGK